MKLHEDDAYMDIQEEIEADTWVCIAPYRLQSETREELEILLLLQSEVFEI